MKRASESTVENTLEVAIIGAGFSGLGMGIQLQKSGISNFRIFEKAADVGGTWRDNTYPGCGCDIKSQLYSYSFEPSAEWSNSYGSQKEIYAYIRHCADKYAMRRHIEFNAEVQGARFDEETGIWTLDIAGSGTVQARHIVSAIGPFGAPSVPDIDGADSFRGKVLHTATWDDSVDLAGKRVGIIGTGASAIQLGPAIAPEVEHLTVFQRTPNWIMPRLDREISEETRERNRKLPVLMKAARLGNYWFNELTAPFLMLRYDVFKKQPELIARAFLHKEVKDKELRRKLTPQYKFGCKRVLVSSAWYSTLQRDNVSLEDTPIERISEKGVVDKNGVEHELDVLVYATGYQVRINGAPFPIIGRDGQLLNDKWESGAEAYNGICTSGFPNLWFLVGPFTGPGHTSVLAYAEPQIKYILQAIKLRSQRGLRFLEVRSQTERSFVKRMERLSRHTVWLSGCSSWYLGPDGGNNTLYPHLNAEYRLRIKRLKQDAFNLVGGKR